MLQRSNGGHMQQFDVVVIGDAAGEAAVETLRKALQTAERDYSNLIQTVRGTGYRFSARGLT